MVEFRVRCFGAKILEERESCTWRVDDVEEGYTKCMHKYVLCLGPY